MVPFVDVLRQARNGVISDFLTDDLTEVVKAVNALNKAGAITLTLKVEPDKHGTAEVTLKWDIKKKLPQRELPNTQAFATVDGDLLRHDPSQRDMFKDTSREAQLAATGN